MGSRRRCSLPLHTQLWQTILALQHSSYPIRSSRLSGIRAFCCGKNHLAFPVQRSGDVPEVQAAEKSVQMDGLGNSSADHAAKRFGTCLGAEDGLQESEPCALGSGAGDIGDRLVGSANGTHVVDGLEVLARC